MNGLFPLARYALILSVAALPVAQSASGFTGADVPLPAGVVRSEVPPDKLEEYARHISDREKRLTQLPKGTGIHLDVPYVKNAFQGKIPMSSQTLDLYIPGGTGPFPLIVYIHGGAWKGGSKESEGSLLATKWIPEGFAVASLNYRFVFDAQFPGMFQDAIDAVSFLREHASEYRLNPNKIGVIGISAGAHIAGLVGMAEGDSKFARTGPAVQALVVLAGFFDMTTETGQWEKGKFVSNPQDDFANLYPNRAYDPEIAKKMSPVYNIHAGSPPVLIVHGAKDITTAPEIQSLIFRDALKKAGVSVTYSSYPNYGHGLIQPDVLDEAIAFFRKNLDVKKSSEH